MMTNKSFILTNKIIPIVIILSAFFFSCRPVKESVRENEYVGSHSEEYKKQTEYNSFFLLELLQRIEAPKERSQTYGLQNSYLSTSLAWSLARVDSTGILHHEIGNHDSIDSKVKYVYRDKNKFDSTDISKRDTVYNSLEVVIEKGLTFWERFWIKTGKICLPILLIIVAFFVGKRFL